MIVPKDSRELAHQHIVYEWPPRARLAPQYATYVHYVFPAKLCNEADVTKSIEAQLDLLVKAPDFFRDFPTFNSPLRMLKDIYMLYTKLGQGILSDMLEQALKLLVLVHIGGDTAVDTDSPGAQAILQATYPGMYFESPLPTNGSCKTASPTPCFIRGQLGDIFRSLATRLMSQVLSALELITVERRCDDWPVVLATFSVVIMTVESIQYHNAKLCFHAKYDGLVGGKESQDRVDARDLHDQAVERLLEFYQRCYPGCHPRLHGRDPAPMPARRSSAGTPNTCRSRSSTLSTMSSPLSPGAASSFGSSHSSSLFSTPSSVCSTPILEHSTMTIRPFQNDADQFIEKLSRAIEETQAYLRERMDDLTSYDGSTAPGVDNLDVFDRLLARLLLYGSC